MTALRQFWHGGAPLLLWAAHFAVSYVLGCHAPLLALSLLAMGACAWMLWRAAPLREEARLLDWARGGGAALALLGIAWTTLPLLLLGGCR